MPNLNHICLIEESSSFRTLGKRLGQPPNDPWPIKRTGTWLTSRYYLIIGAHTVIKLASHDRHPAIVLLGNAAFLIPLDVNRVTMSAVVFVTGVNAEIFRLERYHSSHGDNLATPTIWLCRYVGNHHSRRATASDAKPEQRQDGKPHLDSFQRSSAELNVAHCAQDRPDFMILRPSKGTLLQECPQAQAAAQAVPGSQPSAGWSSPADRGTGCRRHTRRDRRAGRCGPWSRSPDRRRTRRGR